MGQVKGASFILGYSSQRVDALLGLVEAGAELPDPEGFVGACVAAQEAAEAAQSAAEDAQDAAEQAVTDAEGYRNEAQTQASIAAVKATEAAQSAAGIGAKVTAAHSWAVGGTGTRTGEDTNNAKYWAEQAHQIAQNTLIDSVTAKEYSLVVSNGRLYLQEV